MLSEKYDVKLKAEKKTRMCPKTQSLLFADSESPR